MNIHRWRKLEGSDPSTYEMIQKIHTLQRRLIQKTEEVSNLIVVVFLLLHNQSNISVHCEYMYRGESISDKNTGMYRHPIKSPSGVMVNNQDYALIRMSTVHWTTLTQTFT